MFTYRALFIVNWGYRYYTEGFYDVIAAIAGVVQTLVYVVFFILHRCKPVTVIKFKYEEVNGDGDV